MLKLACSFRDHPRGCGEHNNLTHDNNKAVGSSPRMRGAHHPADLSDLPARIIPADAGSTTNADRIATYG